MDLNSAFHLVVAPQEIRQIGSGCTERTPAARTSSRAERASSRVQMAAQKERRQLPLGSCRLRLRMRTTWSPLCWLLHFSPEAVDAGALTTSPDFHTAHDRDQVETGF